MSLIKTIVDACKPFVVYNQRATPDAVVPYGVLTLTSVDVPNQGAVMARQTASIVLYDEYRETGGQKRINEKAAEVVEKLKGHLAVDGLGFCYGTYKSENAGITRVASVDVWRKTIVLEFLTSK